MSKEEVLLEIQEALGVVPTWLAHLPEHELGEVWTAVRTLLLEGVTLSPREKGQVCVAVGVALRCHPLVSLGAAVARRAGDTTPEVVEARRVADAASWLSGYFGVDGLFDYQHFETDLAQSAAFMRTAMNIA